METEVGLADAEDLAGLREEGDFAGTRQMMAEKRRRRHHGSWGNLAFKAPFLISLVHKGGLRISKSSSPWKWDRNAKSWPHPQPSE